VISLSGAIAEAGAQQAGDMMQDLKTGHLLKASPKAQFFGQMIGMLFKSSIANVSNGFYFILTSFFSSSRFVCVSVCGRGCL
jgi:uncharacterized oligopeptide transporter (OPT) family protein